MTEQEFITSTAKSLIAKGKYTKSQATMVARNMWKNQDKQVAQYGGGYSFPNSLGYESEDPMKNPSGFETGFRLPYDRSETPQRPMANQFDYQVPQDWRNENAKSVFDQYDMTGEVWEEKTQQQDDRFSIFNPYSGVDLETSLTMFGQGLGEKDYTKAGLAGGLGLLKSARLGMSGYATGKANRATSENYFKELFKDQRKPTALQQGGMKNSEILASNAITDEDGNPNAVNLEHGEYVKRVQGEVQPVVGEKHIKNGKLGEGVDATLNDGDKVLSDYVKLRPADIRELKERYDISLKKGDTPATALKKVEAKIGLKKETQELAKLAEDLEKTLGIKDETTKEINAKFLEQEIGKKNEKIGSLEEVSKTAFDDIFEKQEKVAKKGDGTQIFDKNGKEVTEVDGVRVGQQGGVMELAKKYGISEERVNQLMQEGGEQQGQPTAEDIIMRFAEIMGQDPQEIIAQLQQLQPEEQQEMLSQMVQAVQGGAEQGQEQEIAQQGRFGMGNDFNKQIFNTMQGSLEALPNIDYSQYNVNVEPELNPDGTPVMTNPEGTYDFSTTLNPQIKGYKTEGYSIYNQGKMQGVEKIQPYNKDVGYGAQMQDVNKTIDTHKWYFDTEEKKKAFKEAVMREGNQPEVLAFQQAYNKEIEKRGKEAGMSEAEINKTVGEVGFAETGVQQFDGKFGAFTSSRPLYDFTKTPSGTVEVNTLEDTSAIDPTIQGDARTKSALAALPYDLRLPPSAMPALLKSEVALGRYTPVKQTTEPYLAEQERQSNTARLNLEAQGLPPQIAEAIMAQQIAGNGMVANDAISKVEAFNKGQQQQVDNLNINQRSKEDITNQRFAQDYQNKVLGSMTNSERDWRRYINEGNAQNRSNYQSIENSNLLNATADNYTYTPGQGITYNSDPSIDLSRKFDIDPSMYTAEQLHQLKLDVAKAEEMKRKKANARK